MVHVRCGKYLRLGEDRKMKLSRKEVAFKNIKVVKWLHIQLKLL